MSPAEEASSSGRQQQQQQLQQQEAGREVQRQRDSWVYKGEGNANVVFGYAGSDDRLVSVWGRLRSTGHVCQHITWQQGCPNVCVWGDRPCAAFTG